MYKETIAASQFRLKDLVPSCMLGQMCGLLENAVHVVINFDFTTQTTFT